MEEFLGVFSGDTILVLSGKQPGTTLLADCIPCRFNSESPMSLISSMGHFLIRVPETEILAVRHQICKYFRNEWIIYSEVYDL